MDDKSKKVRDLLSSYYGTESAAGFDSEAFPSGPSPTAAVAAPKGRPRLASLDRAEFDGDAYVRNLVAKSKFKTLLSQHNKLVHELRGLDASLQALVYENYSKFISATDTIRTMGDAMDKRGVHMMSKLKETATSLKSKMDVTDARLSSSRARIDELSGVRLMLRKLKQAADLPAKLRRLLEMDDGRSNPAGAQEDEPDAGGSSGTARLMLASSYVIDASPSLPSLMRLPPPMCTAAAEILQIRKVCEDRLISMLSSSSDCGSNGGEDDDVDIDEICEMLVKLIQSSQGNVMKVDAAANGRGAADEDDINTDIIVTKLIRAESERARRIVDRATAATVGPASEASARIAEINKTVLPLLSRALHRWKLLFSSVMEGSGYDDGSCRAPRESSMTVVSRLCHDVFEMYLGAVEDCLRRSIVSVFDPPDAGGDEARTEQTGISLLRSHCDCLKMVAVDVGRIASASDCSDAGAPGTAGIGIGADMMRQTTSVIEREVCRALDLLRDARQSTFDARAIFTSASAPSSLGEGDTEPCAVYEGAVSGLEASIDVMVATLTDYCLLLTNESASVLMLREWEAAFIQRFRSTSRALLGSIPTMITTMAELVKEFSRTAEASSASASHRIPMHESIQRLSKISRSVSSMLSDRTLPAIGRWAVPRGGQDADCGDDGMTPIDRVSPRLEEIASSLQQEYMVMDSEEEAQKLMDEVARGLEKAQASDG